MRHLRQTVVCLLLRCALGGLASRLRDFEAWFAGSGGFFPSLLSPQLLRGACSSTALQRSSGGRDLSDFASLRVVAVERVPRETVGLFARRVLPPCWRPPDAALRFPCHPPPLLSAPPSQPPPTLPPTPTPLPRPLPPYPPWGGSLIVACSRPRRQHFSQSIFNYLTSRRRLYLVPPID